MVQSDAAQKYDQRGSTHLDMVLTYCFYYLKTIFDEYNYCRSLSVFTIGSL